MKRSSPRLTRLLRSNTAMASMATFQARIRDADFRDQPRFFRKDSLYASFSAWKSAGSVRKPRWSDHRRPSSARVLRGSTRCSSKDCLVLACDVGRGPITGFRTGSIGACAGMKTKAVRDDAVGVRTEGLRVLRQIVDRSHVVRVGNVPTTKRSDRGLVVLRVYTLQDILNSDGVEGGTGDTLRPTRWDFGWPRETLSFALAAPLEHGVSSTAESFAKISARSGCTRGPTRRTRV